MHRLARQRIGNRELAVQAAQMNIHHYLQLALWICAAGNNVFPINTHQSSPAPGSCAQVLNLPGFLKNFPRQHDGLIRRRDIGIEHRNVLRIINTCSPIGGSH